MKRSLSELITTVILAFVLTFSLVSSCSAAQNVEVVNDGSQLILNINNRQIMGDQPPYIDHNCTLVPVSVVAKELGAIVEWNQSAQTVTINKGNQIVLTIGSTTATVNGAPTTLQAPAVITNGRTMVPLRFVSEALGTEVNYIPQPGAAVATGHENEFQTGNSNPLNVLKLKNPRDLKDSRTTTMVWGMIKDPINNWYDWAKELKKDGFTDVSVTVNFIDGQAVDLSYANAEKEIPQDYINYFKYLKQNGITLRTFLVYWDMQYRLDGGTLSYDRLNNEAEVQRYLDYVKMVVTSLKGLGFNYEIWNEPEVNRDTYQQIKTDDYIKVAKRVIPLIREIDPQAKIILPSTGNYVDSDSREFSQAILNSDLVKQADFIALHTCNNDASPEFLKDYYYGYDVMWNGIKATAEKNGFHGRYIVDGLTYRSKYIFSIQPEIGNYHPYESEVAAKYYGRMMAINRGMDISLGLGGTNAYERVCEGRMIRNLSYLLEGLEVFSFPVNVESDSKLVRYYTFKDAQGNLYLTIWNDNAAAVNYDGIECNISIPNTASKSVLVMDPFNAFQQKLVTVNNGGDLMLEKVVLKDYPMVIKISR